MEPLVLVAKYLEKKKKKKYCVCDKVTLNSHVFGISDYLAILSSAHVGKKRSSL